MAYPAVISLRQTINGLLRNSSRINPVISEILESAYNHTTSLKQLLNDTGSQRLSELDGKIRDCAHELEDVLELHEPELYSQHKGDDDDAIASLGETLKHLELEYIQELSKHSDDDGDGDGDYGASSVPSYPDFGVEEMVGNSEEFGKVREVMLYRLMPHESCFFLLHGEVGSGRKIIANAIFEYLRKEFECCAWVTMGAEEFQPKQVLEQILAQVDNNHQTDEAGQDVCKYLCRVLEHRRYMIVLDGVRDALPVEYLRSSLPNRSNGSRVFLISSLLSEFVSDLYVSFGIPVSFFQEIVLTALLSLVFGDDAVPPEFQEVGKKIVENCPPLCLSAAKTLLFLHKTDKKIEEWRKIAADKQNPVFIVGDDELSEIRTIIAALQSYCRCRPNLHYCGTCRFISPFVNLNVSIEKIKMMMKPERFFGKMLTISLLGMAGIGKSTLARKIFNDRSIARRYDHRVWVNMGPKYQSGDVLIDILAQIYPTIDKKQMKEDAELTHNLCVQLSNQRCLIVLDDLWSKEPLCHLKDVFPDIMGSTLITTRLEEVAENGKDDFKCQMKLLDDEESWSLFRKKVFGEKFCPAELEKAGRKIVENCDGLPLLILTVADQLLKVGQGPDLELWNNVASGKEKSVFKNAHDEISKGLLPSYEMLPQNLKACFLYKGVFCNRYEIPTSKLTNLWNAEGFLEPDLPQMFEDFAAKCIAELAGRSMVMAHHSRVSNSQIKTCRLHPIFWHLSNSVATKNKFFYGMNYYVDCYSSESIESERRLSIRNNVLLGLNDVNDVMESFTTTHSLLCVGPPLQYAVPINFNLRLLRVMDALTIRLYEFPFEVLKLIHLRYLGLTCNGNLPASISSLWKLQYLIVKRYMSIKSSKNVAPLPVEIWDMKEVIHLQIVGGRLPNPKRGGGLPKLLTLLDVSAESCKKKVLKGIPNLKRLGIRIELVPTNKGNPFRFLNRIARLHRLESLKCVVVNPRITSDVVAPPRPVSMFPSSLKKLSLSGFGYPWEYMTLIGSLENLEVLKLKHYAFQGPKWVVDGYDEFKKLNSISIDDADLVHWECKKSMYLQQLNRVSIRHCYKLQELPLLLLPSEMNKIEVVDCHPSVVTWTDKMRQMLPQTPSNARVIDVNLSWTAPRSRLAA